MDAGFEGITDPEEEERGGEDRVLITDFDDADGGVAEFSSSLGQNQRSRIIRRARTGAVRVIVCSDGMARGMDLDGVGLVVNYDVPSQAKTYVHRCDGGETQVELGTKRGWCVAICLFVSLVYHFEGGCVLYEVIRAGSRV